MHFTTTTGLVLGLAASSALAHMEMSFPAPFRSKFNPNAGSNIDYSMTSPLKADGSDYPCKGYQSDFGTSAGKSTATFSAGTTNNITIVGGAPHEGGSCQVSLSSDSGKTFTVIQSIIGNCPVQTSGNFNFEIPSDAPTGDVILAWSWHNAVGNREMYMNCAAVTITGGSSKVKKDTAEKIEDKKQEKRATAYSSRPQIFVANVGNGCTTIEGSAVEYPSPGDDVTKNSQAAVAPSGSCGTSSGGSSGSGSGSSAASSAAASTPVAESTSAAAAEATTSALILTVVPISSPASSSSSLPGGVFFTATTSGAAEATTTPEATAEPTTLATVTTAAGGSGSGAATTTSAAAAASGTGTTGSGSAFTVGTACTDEGQWNCIGGTSFQRCASGMWSAEIAMAAGTSCTAGVSDSLDMFASANKARRFHSAGGKNDVRRRRYEGARKRI